MMIDKIKLQNGLPRRADWSCLVSVVIFTIAVGVDPLLEQRVWAAPVDPLPSDQVDTFQRCYATEISKVMISRGFEVVEDINCDKADFPACRTKTDSKSVVYQATPNSIILSASSRSTKADHARDVGISLATISADKRTASAVLNCRGWGCDLDRGGSPGRGFVSGTEQHQPMRNEIDDAVSVCAEKLKTGP